MVYYCISLVNIILVNPKQTRGNMPALTLDVYNFFTSKLKPPNLVIFNVAHQT